MELIQAVDLLTAAITSCFSRTSFLVVMFNRVNRAVKYEVVLLH